MGLGWNSPDHADSPENEVVAWLSATPTERLVDAGYWSPTIQERLEVERRMLARRLAGVSDEDAERVGG